MRVLKDGSDRRFDKARDSPGTFLVFWSLQGVWVWVTLLPTLLLNTVKRDVPLGNKDYLGYGLWATGFLFEVVADMQKSIFRANPDNDVSLDLSIVFKYFHSLLSRESSFQLVCGQFQGIQITLEKFCFGLDSIFQVPVYSEELST